jgi:hypothetical protein
MHFNRDRSGRVTSFDVATDMVRLRFTKIEDANWEANPVQIR